MAAGAGIYKWAMVTPEVNDPVWGSMVDELAPTPEPTLNKSLVYGLLREYVSDPFVSDTDVTCIAIEDWKNKRVLRRDSLDLRYIDGKWTLYHTGSRCKGLETWEIDDATGAITYLGSSTSPATP